MDAIAQVTHDRETCCNKASTEGFLCPESSSVTVQCHSLTLHTACTPHPKLQHQTPLTRPKPMGLVWSQKLNTNSSCNQPEHHFQAELSGALTAVSETSRILPCLSDLVSGPVCNCLRKTDPMVSRVSSSLVFWQTYSVPLISFKVSLSWHYSHTSHETQIHRIPLSLEDEGKIL